MNHTTRTLQALQPALSLLKSEVNRIQSLVDGLQEYLDTHQDTPMESQEGEAALGKLLLSLDALMLPQRAGRDIDAALLTLWNSISLELTLLANHRANPWQSESWIERAKKGGHARAASRGKAKTAPAV